MSIAQFRRAAVPALIVALAAFAATPASAAPSDKNGKNGKPHAAKSVKTKKHKAVHTQAAPAAQAPARGVTEFPPDKYNPGSGY